MPFDTHPPITATDIVTCSEQQVTFREAELFLRGLSPGIPALGLCEIGYKRAQARRYTHPAYPRAVARRYAKALASAFIPTDALVRMLQQTNGLHEIGDLSQRYDIATKLDALVEADRAARVEAAE